MKINGVELEDLDVYDVEVAEKYDKALETVENISEEVDIMSLSEGIRYQCNLIFDFFNTMFGEGADRKIFGNKVNLLTCLKAFEEFVEIINEQKKEIDKLANKYSPNRATRRSKK